jgi:hypothetical protein
VICGIIIVASMAIIALDNILDGSISSTIRRLTFYGEAAGLVSFGIAWLTASRILPFITRDDERLTLSPFNNREE